MHDRVLHGDMDANGDLIERHPWDERQRRLDRAASMGRTLPALHEGHEVGSLLSVLRVVSVQAWMLQR